MGLRSRDAASGGSRRRLRRREVGDGVRWGDPTGDAAMTEAEWLACEDPFKMLAFLRFKFGVRKLGLFAVACHRREWQRLNELEQSLVESTERSAESREEIAARSPREAHKHADAVHYVAFRAVQDELPSGRIIQADLLRDIFGNPFRPVAVDPRWLTSDVVELARGIYADCAFDRLPILADALQDAGCDHPDVLTHCRCDGPHVRGCWVVDLLLGKT
jgi:hypothetical protein